MDMSCVETKPIVGKIGAHISKIKSPTPFIVNKPHDAPEILNYLLNEMFISPTYSRDTVVMTTEVSICCQSFFSESKQEDYHTMLKVPVRSSISASVVEFFKSYTLDGENMWFCPLYKGLPEHVQLKCQRYLLYN